MTPLPYLLYVAICAHSATGTHCKITPTPQFSYDACIAAATLVASTTPVDWVMCVKNPEYKGDER